MKLQAEHFHRQVKSFRKLLQSQQQRVTVKGVHDLRVSTRRLRSLLWLYERSGSQKSDKTLKQHLKQLGKSLGEKRQWDVALKDARKYHLASKSLQKKQKSSGLKLQKVLRGPATAELLNDLLLWDRSIQKKYLLISMKRLKPLKSDLRSWLRIQNPSRKKMHELRISTKKIRYVFEALKLPAKKLKFLQDHLGKSHDLTLLITCFQDSKAVKRDEKKEHKKAKKQIRPALRSSLEVMKSLR